MKSPRTQSKHKGGTSLQVKLPVGVRDEVDAVLLQIGIDMPTAVRIYINKIIQTRSIPFQLAAPEIKVEVVEVDDETQKKMDDVARIWKQHKTVQCPSSSQIEYANRNLEQPSPRPTGT